MTKNKNLILITTDTIIPKLKKLMEEKGLKDKEESKEKEESMITFLFPITDFCVGIPKTFAINEIKEEGFIFINRILDKEGIANFKKMLTNLPNNIKGIVFDDIGVLNVLLETKNDLTKILFLNHLNCNYESINSYLDYVDSVVISTDITKDETKEILKQAKQPLVVYAFGYVAIMYSRRTLLTNYNNHFNASIPKSLELTESMSKKTIKAFENTYGTVIYTNAPFNNLSLRNEENILYNFFNTTFMNDEEIIYIIKNENNEDSMENVYPYKYLSEEETIYKIKGGD